MPRSPWLASAGMDEVRRRAGARHGGGDLARDVAGLADAAHHHAAVAAVDQLDRGEEALVDALDQRAHRVGLDLQHAPRQVERAGGVAGIFARGCGAAFIIGAEYSPWTHSRTMSLPSVLILLASGVLGGGAVPQPAPAADDRLPG